MIRETLSPVSRSNNRQPNSLPARTASATLLAIALGLAPACGEYDAVPNEAPPTSLDAGYVDALLEGSGAVDGIPGCGHDHEIDLATATLAISSGGVLPTVFPSRNTVVGSYTHGKYPSWGNRTHLGVDVVESPTDSVREPVHAMAAGYVVNVVSSSSDSNFGSLGYAVILRHNGAGRNGRTVYSLHLHLESAPSVRVGDSVTRGQRIGSMGMTGAANGSRHTHFEVRYFSTRYFADFGNIYGPIGCDLRNAGSPPESTDGDSCDAADYRAFVDNWENPQTYTVPAVPAPSMVNATDGTASPVGSVRITWNAVNREGVVYDVYSAMTSISSGSIIASGITTNSYSDRSGLPGTTRYYRVRARSSDGTSALSAANAGSRVW